jgi:hypothetical protein
LWLESIKAAIARQFQSKPVFCPARGNAHRATSAKTPHLRAFFFFAPKSGDSFLGDPLRRDVTRPDAGLKPSAR